LTNALCNTMSPERSFNQQLDIVLKLINEYTLAVTSAEELTKAETYTLYRVYCFLKTNVKFSLIRQRCVRIEKCALQSIHFCNFFMYVPLQHSS
jgi:hypothetical protein